MIIWIDADSCPAKIRDIVARAAKRTAINAIFVANRNIPLAKNRFVKMVLVESGEGKADDYIIENCCEADIAVTRDIPLANELLKCNAVVLNDRGTQYTKENIRERLSIRDLMKDFREVGIMDSGRKTFSNKEVQAFAAAFDRELAKKIKSIE